MFNWWERRRGHHHRPLEQTEPDINLDKAVLWRRAICQMMMRNS